MPESMNKLWDAMVKQGPDILIALAMLVVGWVVARIARAVVVGILKRARVDTKLAGLISSGGTAAKPETITKAAGGVVFWVLLLYAITFAADRLGLEETVAPITNLLHKVVDFIPNLAGAALFVIIAAVLAHLVRSAVTGALANSAWEKKLVERVGGEEVDAAPVSKSVGGAAYALVWLFFLVPILGTLGLRGLLEPVQGLLAIMLGFIPNLIYATVILIVGFFIAKMLRQVATSLTAAAGIDKVGERTGLAKVGKGSLSELIGTVVFILILVPVLTMALDKLELQSVSEPIQGMLEQFAAALPKLFAGGVILGVAWIIGKLISGLAADLLARAGFDNLFVALGLSKDAPQDGDGRRSPAQLAGTLVLIAVMLVALTQAAQTIGFTALEEMLDAFIAEATGWLKGIVFFGLGLWFANFVAGIIKDRETEWSNHLATIARAAILVLASTMALREMEVGEEIVETAFTLAFGAIAVSAALAFGLGGRDAAARQLDNWTGHGDGGEAAEPAAPTEDAPAE